MLVVTRANGIKPVVVDAILGIRAIVAGKKR
jgi:hypothetical protein